MYNLLCKKYHYKSYGINANFYVKKNKIKNKKEEHRKTNIHVVRRRNQAMTMGLEKRGHPPNKNWAHVICFIYLKIYNIILLDHLIWMKNDQWLKNNRSNYNIDNNSGSLQNTTTSTTTTTNNNINNNNFLLIANIFLGSLSEASTHTLHELSFKHKYNC